MVLTNGQEKALRIAVQRHKDGEKYTVISGPAGTGKSTLVKFIIQALDVSIDRVCYATFTGKAAQVLIKKGNKNALTLHKLLYDSIPLPAGGFLRKPKATLEYDIVVVDEISMVPKELVELLFNHKVYTICLGDPFQLPPIERDSDNHLLDKPHVYLDEIMRQAKESEIIRLTMDIRDNKPLELFKGNEVQVLNKSDLVDGMCDWADQILVATNNKRQEINYFMRQEKGYGEEPTDGDKIICLKNYWDSFGNNEEPLVNGTIGILNNPYNGTISVPKFAYNKGYVDVLFGQFISDTGIEYGTLAMDPNIIVGGESKLDWREKYKLNKLKSRMGELVPKEFAYAYAITVHKAQGSQWPSVLVIEETFPFSKEEHARWLYTACTRAEEKLVVLRN